MAPLTQAPKGTLDTLPRDSFLLRKIENQMIEIAENFGFKEIRTPTFEHTELFCRSVGDTTDVVQKEMYTFEDKGGRSITLRPEGTAGAMRAVVEHGLTNEPMPLKLFYLLSCFRHEKPQAGRLREFHQFGAELLGSSSPKADAEVILLADSLLSSFEIGEYSLEINSLGCKSCRGEYTKKLIEYFSKNEETLCETCKGRLNKNPLRILDCKSPICKKVAADAPKITEFLCEDCSEHYKGVKKSLDSMGVKYKENPDIVRGLDYYNRTVFEFISSSLGAQSTVCGGGRYDGLISQLGGNDCASLGFGLGIERLVSLYNLTHPEKETKKPKIFISSIGEAASNAAFKYTGELRNKGVFAECDIVGRSLKAQMKYADKLGAKYSIVLGDDEIASGKAVLKDMESGEKREIELRNIAEEIK
ncbi:MAG: histidine--tRNA ligase [Oscillospiraceae bacterium]|nr:histidine--tRNA ligase [Oscillospiraceae bacterium]